MMALIGIIMGGVSLVLAGLAARDWCDEKREASEEAEYRRCLWMEVWK